MGKSWLMDLEFEAERRRLGAVFAEEKGKFADPNWYSRNPVFVAILLTGLTNLARVSEAYDGVKGWIGNGNRTQLVLARKHGKEIRCLDCSPSPVWRARGKTGRAKSEEHRQQTNHRLEETVRQVEREIMMPQEIEDEDREVMASLWDDHLTLPAVKMYAHNKLGVRTHALRYAGVSELGDRGVPAQVGMTITKHASADQFAKYQQTRAGHNVLADMQKLKGKRRSS